jgi:glutamate synthase (NADPH/NADH) small chain
MGKPTGFKEWDRELPKKRERAIRINDFREFIGTFDGEKARAQGGRCMDCGVPFCMQGCPLGNRIPDWNDLVYNQRWKAAFVALDSTNNFPEFTGRLCPAPCEAACVLNVNQDPVTIEQIEKEIVERAFAEGWVAARPPRSRTTKKVAVVGSGPAGLAAAQQLNRAGHHVTVYEKADRIGGLLRYGIPDFKMEKQVIGRRLALMEAEGVVFKTGVALGDELSWSELRVTHDAVVIAIGAEAPRELEVPGRELGGVHLAMSYLMQQNMVVAGDAVPGQIHAEGKRVVILGGGDTGSDCLGTGDARRLSGHHARVLGLCGPEKHCGASRITSLGTLFGCG